MLIVLDASGEQILDLLEEAAEDALNPLGFGVISFPAT
jgi:hypothetical protein